MKNNYIAKHMNTYNRNSVHIDRKKEGISIQDDIDEGLDEYNKDLEVQIQTNLCILDKED